jgi:type II secretory pathway pseudopilin PulG
VKAPALFARHRVVASVIVMVLFAVAITAAILRVSALDDAEEAKKQQAAIQEAASLRADFQANQAQITASIRADIAAGRIDDADRLLKKYRPVANGSLDRFSPRSRTQ